MHGPNGIDRLRGQHAQIVGYAEAMQNYGQGLLRGDFSGWDSILREVAKRNITYLAWLEKWLGENEFYDSPEERDADDKRRSEWLAEYRAKVAREREIYGDLSEEALSNPA